MLHLGIGGHGNSSTKIFGGQKPCYNSQWPLASHYFKCCMYKAKLLGNNEADNANGILKKCNNHCSIKIFK